MKRYLLALPALAIAMMVIFASTGQAVQAAAVSLNLRAGDGETGYSVNMFLPESVYIRPGDTLTWKFNWDEPHTVTFGTPAGDPTVPTNPDDAVVSYDGTGFVSSGLVFPTPEGAKFSMKFTTPGTYQYFCVIHPGMTGVVNVQDDGIGEQDNQPSIDGRGASTYSSAISVLKAAAGSAAAKPVAVTGSGAGRKFTLQVSSSNDLPVGDVMQFFPASLTIGVNDSVEFVSNVHTPHDVIFPGPADLNGPPPPGLEDFDPFTQDLNYSPGVKLDNSKPVISPMIGLDDYSTNKISFSFAKTGTYKYECVLHGSQGMRGTINVTATGAPLPPNTGDAVIVGSPQSGTTGLWIVFGAVAIAFAATGVAFATTRK
ncbi:MAG: plastocyanin/azurin family copper-binding protein [Dehalococcoidia bacterium]